MARVLVVDDEPDICDALTEALRLAGYETATAATGASALVEVRRQPPDLILLDQMLPDVDGTEICRRLRSAADTKRVPIIFVTARGSAEARIAGLALGADDYIVKPFSMQELLLRTRAVLRRSAPATLSMSPDWLRLRDQYRVWTGYADLHFARAEWQDCFELSRAIANACEEVLTSAERAHLYGRLVRCAQELGDAGAEHTWQERARAV